MAESTPDIWSMADLVTPFAIRAVATLRVADAVKDGPMPVRELARRCDSRPDALGRLLRFLVCRGVFVEPTRDTFGPNDASYLLESDHPEGAREWLDLTGAVGRADLAFAELAEQVRGQHPAYIGLFGRSFWEDLAYDSRLSDSFDDLMETKSSLIAPTAAHSFDWSRFSIVADVGGGKGVLLAEILRAHSSVLGMLIELPRPAESATNYLREQGVLGRAETFARDFFEPLPTGADAYVLCDVLGDWDDTDAVGILTRCTEAAGQDGHVLVVESMPDEDARSQEIFSEMDLRMMVYAGGRMRDLEGIRRIAAEAGLTVAETTRLDSGYRIIECVASR